MKLSVKTFQISINVHSPFIQWVPNVPEVPSGVLKIEICAVVVRFVGHVRSLAHLPYIVTFCIYNISVQLLRSST